MIRIMNKSQVWSKSELSCTFLHKKLSSNCSWVPVYKTNKAGKMPGTEKVIINHVNHPIRYQR